MAFKKPDQSDNPLSPQEDEIYLKASKALQTEIERGKPFVEACKILTGVEPGLRDMVQDDFIKIFIAEHHFGQGKGFDDIALLLGLPYERVMAARAEMLDEVGQQLASQYRREISKTCN